MLPRKLLEAQAWHTQLTLPPFLPILYSDYILDEQRTIWRYDARDRSGAVDREVEGTWSTLKVKTLLDRLSVNNALSSVEAARTQLDGLKKEEDDAGSVQEIASKAVEADEKNLKILVKNLAERGAVRCHLTF